MNDTFARIGLAFHHLLAQSSINGPAREEVSRLATELQTLEVNINDMVNERVGAAVDGIEARIMAHVDGNFESLATVLEAAEIDFTPTPAPAPVIVEPAPDPAPAPQAQAEPPVPTTGNIPAPPDPASEAAPEPAPAPEVEPAPAAEEPVAEAPVVDGGDPNAQASEAAPAGEAPAAELAAEPAPEVAAGDAPAPAEVEAAPAPEATGAADTTVMVEGGASDVKE